jgi:hypothetical protein
VFGPRTVASVAAYLHFRLVPQGAVNSRFKDSTTIAMVTRLQVPLKGQENCRFCRRPFPCFRVYRRCRLWAQLPPNWRQAPLYKRVLLALVFFFAFLLLDGSSAPATQWEGSPACYFPVGLSVALLFVGGIAYSPLVMLASIAAAYLNYHRPFLSWCGIPGATALYLPYVLAIKFLREHLQINSKLTRIREIGAFTVVLLIAEIPCAVIGMCTLWEMV